MHFYPAIPHSSPIQSWEPLPMRVVILTFAEIQVCPLPAWQGHYILLLQYRYQPA